MEYQITELINVEKNQRLLDGFCDSVGIAAAIFAEMVGTMMLDQMR